MKRKSLKRDRPISSFFDRKPTERSSTQLAGLRSACSASAECSNASGHQLPTPSGGLVAEAKPPFAENRRGALKVSPTSKAATESVCCPAALLDRSNIEEDDARGVSRLPSPFTSALAASTTLGTYTLPSRTDESAARNNVGGYNEQHQEETGKKPRVASDEKQHTAIRSTNPACRAPQHGKNGNIAHRLMWRAVVGSRSRMSCGTFVPKLQWKSASWIKFYDANAPTLRFSKNHSRMAWDQLGVLLAVSSDSLVRIYDWDMVRWADVKARNLRAARQGGEFAVEPILVFQVRSSNSTPCNITVLSWSPYNSDELIVGTRNGDVYAYDLGTELRNGAPWCRTLFRADDVRSKHQSVSGIVLVQEGKLLIVSLECSVFCVSVGTRRIVWEWSTSSFGRATCIEAVPRTNFVLLGSSSGCFSLLDYSKFHRQGFGCSSSPAVVLTWLSYGGCGPTPSGSDMGIRQIRFNVGLSLSPGTRSTSHSFSFAWVTNCGWVLRTSVDAGSNHQPRSSILYSTAPVKLENSSGVPVPSTAAIREWSLPFDSCVSTAATSSSLLWEAVPDVRRVLPCSDLRVLDSKPRIIRDSSSPKLMLLNDHDSPDKIQIVQLPKRKSRPTALSVHPSHEWIVVASMNDLYALSTRGISKLAQDIVD